MDLFWKLDPALLTSLVVTGTERHKKRHLLVVVVVDGDELRARRDAGCEAAKVALTETGVGRFVLHKSDESGVFGHNRDHGAVNGHGPAVLEREQGANRLTEPLVETRVITGRLRSSSRRCSRRWAAQVNQTDQPLRTNAAKANQKRRNVGAVPRAEHATGADRWPVNVSHRSTRTTSYSSAVGGKPVSNLAFTAASWLP
jgi:hypothetical protein